MGLVFHRGRPFFAHVAKGGNHTAGAMGFRFKLRQTGADESHGGEAGGPDHQKQ
jgi:hypothetical protein